MFILLNGAFGVGKTTAAMLLASEIPGATLYDPERLGFILSRLPGPLVGVRRQPEDYQDIRLWREAIIWGARRAHRRSPPVIVPMCFSNKGYFTHFRDALATTARIRPFCLVAPLAVIRDRLAMRANAAGRAPDRWAMDRVSACLSAHRDECFGAHVDATQSPAAIVRHLRNALRL